MIQSSKVLWGEGLFLRPQHFQRQDAYHEWRLAEATRALHPYGWGVRGLQLDHEALASGILRFGRLQLVFPDGELYSAPQEDELPAPVSLDSIPAGTSEVTYVAAMAPLRESGQNDAAPASANDGPRRYAQKKTQAPDWFTDAAESEVVTLRRRVQVMVEGNGHDHLVSLQLCRVRRSASGSFEADVRFVPPCVSIDASPALQVLLRRLLDILQAKVDALYGYHREPSKHVIEFRSGDIASFWLLHTASSAFASLSHLYHHPGLHPERLYQRMLELAGALLTFSKSHSLAALPPYSHSAPAAGFIRLDELVRELLETVISTRYFAIALNEAKPSFHSGRIDSGNISAGTSLYLGVRAALPGVEIVDMVPLRFKLGAPDDVEKLVLSAMAGVKLAAVAQVPGAIPVRPGAVYFEIESRGPLYERMLQGQTIMIYAPGGIPELQLELFALNP